MAGPVDPRLLRRARATRSYLVAGVGVGIATAILAIGQAWLLSRLVVGAFEAHRLVRADLLGWLAGLFAARAALSGANQVLAHRAAAAVKSRLRADVVAARLAAPDAAPSTGDRVTLLTTGLDALDNYFGRYLPQLALAVTVPFIVLGVTLWVDWPSAIVMAVTLPLIPVFMALIGWTTQAQMARRWRVQLRLARHFADLIQGLPTLQVFGRAAAQERGLAETEARSRTETMRTLRVSFLSAFALELVATISVAVIAVGIGLRVVAGEMGFLPGLFVLVLAPEAYLPLRLVGLHYHDSAAGTAAAGTALDAIAAAEAIPRGHAPAPSLATATLRLEGVGHTYPGATAPALAPLDLELAPGEVVALAGPTGRGKTTALGALLGFLAPTSGRITIGGRDLAEIDAASWRRQLAFVGQAPGMVAGTIADNVRLGHPAATDEEVRGTLARAGGAELDPDRDVGDDGEGLSAGERRRVAMARALLRIDHGARLLVLDEPTAGLDADAEAALLAGLRGTGAGALVVSHRPAVLAAADRVVEVAAP